MKKTTRIGFIVLLVFMLVAVRAFVQPYFYDPLIAYFKTEYLYSSIPEINFFKFFLNIFLRYSLNSVISLAILYLVFDSLRVLKFSLKFYLFAFLILSIVLYVLLEFDLNLGYRIIFYVRRFLIHPIFLLILVPAFYYQKLKFGKAIFK